MSRKKGKEQDVEIAIREEVVPDLPGFDAVDSDLVDDVVAEVNRVHAARGLELARELGEILVRRFFDGDLDNFRRAGKKHASFRALSERSDDLTVSYAQLWNSVAVLDQLRALPEDIGMALSMHHHKALLSVRDEKKKLELAERARDRAWSYRELAREVRKAKGRTKAGRPALPAWVKGLKRLVIVVEEALSGDVRPDDFAHYDPRDARKLVERLDEQVELLVALKAKVLSRAAEAESAASST